MQWRSDPRAHVDAVEFEREFAAARAMSGRERGSARAKLARIVPTYAGDLLPDCYDEWIVPHRDRLHASALGALDLAIRLAEEQHDHAAALAHAEHLLRLDPLEERTYLRLMRLHALNGDHAAALRRLRDVRGDAAAGARRGAGRGDSRRTRAARATERYAVRAELGSPAAAQHERPADSARGAGAGVAATPAGLASGAAPRRRPGARSRERLDSARPVSARRCSTGPTRRASPWPERGRTRRRGGSRSRRSRGGCAADRCASRSARLDPLVAHGGGALDLRAPRGAAGPRAARAARRVLAAAAVLRGAGARGDGRGAGAGAAHRRPPVVRRRDARVAALPAPLRGRRAPARGRHHPRSTRSTRSTRSGASPRRCAGPTSSSRSRSRRSTRPRRRSSRPASPAGTSTRAPRSGSSRRRRAIRSSWWRPCAPGRARPPSGGRRAGQPDAAAEGSCGDHRSIEPALPRGARGGEPRGHDREGLLHRRPGGCQRPRRTERGARARRALATTHRPRRRRGRRRRDERETPGTSRTIVCARSPRRSRVPSSASGTTGGSPRRSSERARTTSTA